MIEVILDFVYVIFQRRLSSARYLMKTGLALTTVFAGIGSLVGSISTEGMTLSVDNNSSPVWPFLINCLVILGLFFLIIGFLIELYERLCGEASNAHRAKSIDLRTLSEAKAPTLAKSYHSTVESSGIHDDLTLHRLKEESLNHWLDRSTKALSNFANVNLVKLSTFESDHPLALGAIAHVPHCFALGFLTANRRLVNYYCWNRDPKKEEKSRWIDCRDKRTRGQSIKHKIITDKTKSIEDSSIKRLGLSIELSVPSNAEVFLNEIGLDVVCQISLPKQYIGNLFSEKEQVKIINEIRTLLNNQLLTRFSYVEELHITITAQASFIMRFAADLNQNHIPSLIKIYHFERPGYPWSINLSPNKTDVSFSIS